ncbi:hypothetical protein HMPREF0262_03204 [Clostridium sp. ATCC 29733]|nr:hypothetical protein HMPREF0262_03204 [Clostridium sp. ATCC 29733]
MVYGLTKSLYFRIRGAYRGWGRRRCAEKNSQNAQKPAVRFSGRRDGRFTNCPSIAHIDGIY